MEDENRVPLLKKVYFENCPGCKLDQKKDADKGIPYRLFFYVWISVLATGLPISSLFPFLYFMIQDMHIAKRVEDIGFYAGFVGAAFMFGRAVTSVFWGMIADRWGRKPVIIIGLISLIIFNTLFGLSTNYWMAIATRFLLGALNGLVGPIKAYAAEVCRPEHQSIGMSLPLLKKTLADSHLPDSRTPKSSQIQPPNTPSPSASTTTSLLHNRSLSPLPRHQSSSRQHP